MTRSVNPRALQDVLRDQEPSSGVVVSSSAARTSTSAHNSADQTNRDHIGVYVFLDFNAGSDSSGSMQVSIQAKTPGGSYVDIFTGSSFAPSTLANIKSYLISPSGSTKTDGALVGISSAPLPRVWRVQINRGDTGRSLDYSIEAMYV